MCTGAEFALMGSTGMQMLGSWQQGKSKASANIEAARQSGESAGYALAEGQQQARVARRQTDKAIGSATAAIASSGVALDEFSLDITRDIAQRGELDAQLSILSGRREADQLMQQAAQYGKAAGNARKESLINMTSQALSGWKGMAGSKPAATSKAYDPISSFYLGGNRSVGD